MKKGLFLLLPWLFATAAPAQQTWQTVDSVAALLDSTRKDTVQLQRLWFLSGVTWGPRGARYTQELLSLAEILLTDPVPSVRAMAADAKAIALCNSGWDKYLLGDMSGAFHCYNAAVQLRESHGDTAGTAIAASNMGFLYMDIGENEKALERFRHSLRVLHATNVSDRFYRGMETHMVDVFVAQGRSDSAMFYLNKILPLTTGSDSAMVLSRRARVYILEGRSEEALDDLRQAKALLREDLADDQIYYVLNEQFDLLLKLERFPDALAVARHRYKVSMAQERWDKVCGSLVRMGITKQLMGDPAGAEPDLERGLSMAIEQKIPEVILYAVDPLKKIYAAQGKYGKAMDLMDLGVRAADTLRSTNARREMLSLEFKQELYADSLEGAAQRSAIERKEQAELDREHLRKRVLGFTSIGFALVMGGIFINFRSVRRQQREIQQEKDISENLLLNILPEEVAEELKDTGAAVAKHFDNATILFTDFKGFTAMSEKMTPEDLVEELNTCFQAFDHIITARGIEKIKTIGDAYMCAGGLPDPKTSSPADVVQAALEMQSFMTSRKTERDAQGKPAFEMRVGIHTGPVVAGIVGVKKFQYDIWGDTVNTASRMESSGEVGQVNISEATYALVKDVVVGSLLMVVGPEHQGTRATSNQQPSTTPAFTFTPRGKVQAKGKGELEMFFVERKPAVAGSYGG